MSFCPRCGAKVETEDRYCQECGNRLAAVPPAPRSAQATSGSQASTAWPARVLARIRSLLGRPAA